MNGKGTNKGNGRDGGSLNDEFFGRFKGVSIQMAKKIMNQEKNYRKQQLLRKRRQRDLKARKHQSYPGDDVPAPEYAGTVL